MFRMLQNNVIRFSEERALLLQNPYNANEKDAPSSSIDNHLL